MDVKTTILHKDLEEEIYRKQCERFIVKGKKELVYKLKRFLCDLKLSPRMWYQTFSTYIFGWDSCEARLITLCIPSRSMNTLFI
jgi:hypothetical protein